MIGCDASPPFFLARFKCTGPSRPPAPPPCGKAVEATPITRPSKRQLGGRSNQIKQTRVAIERELEARALLQSEEAILHIEGEEESDLEVSDSENESDVEFVQ